MFGDASPRCVVADPAPSPVCSTRHSREAVHAACRPSSTKDVRARTNDVLQTSNFRLQTRTYPPATERYSAARLGFFLPTSGELGLDDSVTFLERLAPHSLSFRTSLVPFLFSRAPRSLLFSFSLSSRSPSLFFGRALLSLAASVVVTTKVRLSSRQLCSSHRLDLRCCLSTPRSCVSCLSVAE